MNLCFNCVDKHIRQGKGSYTALTYYCQTPEFKISYKYSDVLKHV